MPERSDTQSEIDQAHSLLDRAGVPAGTLPDRIQYLIDSCAIGWNIADIISRLKALISDMEGENI